MLSTKMRLGIDNIVCRAFGVAVAACLVASPQTLQAQAPTVSEGLFDAEMPSLEASPSCCVHLDVDGDGQPEAVMTSDAAPGTVAAVAAGGSGADVIVVGVAGGGEIAGTLDIDGDGDLEALVLADALATDTLGVSVGASAGSSGLDVVFARRGVGGESLGAGDLDGDGELEAIVRDPSLAVGTATLADLDGDDMDVLFVGGSATAAFRYGDVDGDGENEILLGDAGVGAGTTSTAHDSDNDGDADVRWLGGELLDVVDLDGDGELEALVLDIGQAWYGTASLDGTAPDAVFVGVSAYRGVLDADGDGELEAVFEEATLANGTFSTEALSGADVDLIRVGVASGGKVAGRVDVDGDGELELIVEDPTRPDTNPLTGSAGGTAPDVVFLGGTGSIEALADTDGNGQLEIFVQRQRSPRGAFTHSLPGSSDVDYVLVDEPDPAAQLRALNLDGDNETEVVVETNNLSLSSASRVRTDFGTLNDADIIFMGTPGAEFVGQADLDGDGDLDLVTAGAEGLHRLDNDGGNQNSWLAIRLRGLAKGNSKNNILGVGSVVEVKTDRAYQFREARGDVVHFGLGGQDEAGVVRVVWTNGVPQNRLQVAGKQQLVEEQLLKGSCPFVYTWDGERIAFVTDLLWGAPIGLPVAPGVYAGADPDELIRLDGAQPREDGSYDLRVTEELWEAAFFDYARLWVVDHPSDVETASNLRIVPGAGPQPDRVLATRDVRVPVAAWDGNNRNVTRVVAARDDVYADGYRPSPYQGVAATPWTMTFDLGTAPDGPIRLLLDGWIFPADASLNLAIAQRQDLSPHPPRLEVETASGWTVLMPNMGHPAGKTKTMVVDTPPLPEGAHRLRIVTGQWLHWDRIAWSTEVADDEPHVVARLAPTVADLRRRGYSAVVRNAPNAPHAFDYATVRHESPWIAFPGRYTKLGDVRPLLAEADDRSVILAPGDEMQLRFDGTGLPPVPHGWQRTVYLESHGWDKDADRNTGEGMRVEPLPFRAMTAYPYAEGESFPDTPEHRAYIDEWLTREVRRAVQAPNPAPSTHVDAADE